MNRYLVFVTGADSIGYSFLKNVTEVASKGGTLLDGKVPTMRFPYSAWMYVESEELLKDKPGFKYQIIAENFTKEQLDEMTWEEVKKAVKARFGITGRDREQLIRQYLSKVEELESKE